MSSSRMPPSPDAAGQTSRTPWPDLIFAALLGAICLWYLLDSYAVSARMENLILVAPACIVALGLCAAIIIGDLRRRSPPASPEGEDEDDFVRPAVAVDWRSIATMGMLILYVLVMVPLGFDLATFLYVVAMLVVLREKSITLILAYSLVFTVVNVWLQSTTSYNIPLLMM